MGGLLHLVQRAGAWAGYGPASPLITVPNVTAHPWTASVPIIVLLYDGPLLCGFNVAIKGFINVCCLHNELKVFCASQTLKTRLYAFCWSTLTTRCALVADAGPSDVRPVVRPVVTFRKLSKIDSQLRRLFCCRNHILSRRPFSRKHGCRPAFFIAVAIFL